MIDWNDAMMKIERPLKRPEENEFNPLTSRTTAGLVALRASLVNEAVDCFEC